MGGTRGLKSWKFIKNFHRTLFSSICTSVHSLARTVYRSERAGFRSGGSSQPQGFLLTQAFLRAEVGSRASFTLDPAAQDWIERLCRSAGSPGAVLTCIFRARSRPATGATASYEHSQAVLTQPQAGEATRQHKVLSICPCDIVSF